MRSHSVLTGLTFLLVSSLALAGCTSNQSPEKPSDGSGTLTITAIDGHKPALDEATAAFSASHANITVKVNYVKVEDAAPLRTQLTSGTASDVIFVQPGNGTAIAIQNLVPGGYLEDLSSRPFAAEVPSTFDPTTKVDGKLYFLPVGLDGIVALYNKATFNELGIEVPQTFDDVLGFCDAAKSKGKVAFAFGAQTPWTNLLPTYAFVATLVFGENPHFDADMAAGKTHFVDSNWNEALEHVLTMQKRGCFTSDPLGTPWEATMGALASGDAVATIQVTPVIPAFKGSAEKGTEFGAFALPATENAKDTWVPLSLVGGYAINAKAKNPVAARIFLDWLAEPANYATYIKTQGSFPPIPVEGFTPPAEIAFLSEFIKENRTYPWMDQLWPNAEVQPPLIEGTQGLLAGNGTIRDVLSQMDAAYAKGSKG